MKIRSIKFCQKQNHRWLETDEDESRRKAKFASYMIFGGGPRICVGLRLAQMIFKSAFVYLLRDFQLCPCPETEVSSHIRLIN